LGGAPSPSWEPGVCGAGEVALPWSWGPGVTGSPPTLGSRLVVARQQTVVTR